MASFYSPFTSLLSFAAGLDLSSLPIRLAEIEYVKYYPMWQPTGRTQAVLNMAYYDGTTAHSSNFVMDFGGVSFGSIEEFFSRTQRVTLQHSFQDAYSAWDEDGYYTYINGYEATMELMSVAPSALAISEPTTVALLGLALTGMAVARRRRVAIN